jgi:hypothetical protein
MTRKVYGIRCGEARGRVPAEWQWLCHQGEPVLWYSLQAAQRACAKVPASLEPAAILYGIERQ